MQSSQRVSEIISWGRLTSDSPFVSKYWLSLVVKCWLAQDTQPQNQEAEAVHQKLTQCIDAVGSATKDAEVYDLCSKFNQLEKKLKVKDSNLFSRTFGGPGGSINLHVGFSSGNKADHSLFVKHCPSNSPHVTAEWCTGTDNDKKFRDMIAEALNALEEHVPATAMLPVKNHHRMACEDLGMNVSHIPEKGINGIYGAREELRQYLENAIEKAEQAALAEGYCIPDQAQGPL